MKTLEIVCATRKTAQQFIQESALGKSLGRLLGAPENKINLFPENSAGLSDVYNTRISAADVADILVFLHDDIWIDDMYFFERIREAVEVFDIVGIAGSKKIRPGQFTWFGEPHARLQEEISAGNLSGRIAHGTERGAPISNYGPAPAECAIVDGVLMAARSQVFLQSGLRFDPRFRFHFYDLDLCRTATGRGLKVGTWPIAVTHESSGSYSNAEWSRSGGLYLQKWGEVDRVPRATSTTDNRAAGSETLSSE